jgi:hypothetical protein
MARLPIVGGDNNNWGTILNDYLSQSINSDGSLNSVAVATAYLAVSFHTTAYTAGSTKSEAILVSANSGPVTITLPTAAGNLNSYSIKKIDSSASFVTVATTSSQTIDGGTTAVLKVQYVSITVVSDGSNWSII